MTRKNLKSQDIKVEVKNAAKGIPRFNEKHGKFQISQFWCDDAGKPSKRAFFFTLFALIACLYILLALITGNFNVELAAYILSCNVAFGVAYQVKK